MNWKAVAADLAEQKWTQASCSTCSLQVWTYLSGTCSQCHSHLVAWPQVVILALVAAVDSLVAVVGGVATSTLASEIFFGSPVCDNKNTDLASSTVSLKAKPEY